MIVFTQPIREAVRPTAEIGSISDDFWYFWKFGKCPPFCHRGCLIHKATQPHSLKVKERRGKWTGTNDDDCRHCKYYICAVLVQLQEVEHCMYTYCISEATQGSFQAQHGTVLLLTERLMAKSRFVWGHAHGSKKGVACLRMSATFAPFH